MLGQPVADAHWDEIYSSRAPDSLGWYQARPATVDDVLAVAGEEVAVSVVDVGGGASTFVDHVLDAGISDITVLDLAPSSLAITEARLGNRASDVAFEVGDVLTWRPRRTWSIWHDRAVFHFLTESEDRLAYVDTLRRSVDPGGHAVIATFGPGGPEQCAGLDVRRYDEGELAAEFASDFERITCRRSASTTAGQDQRPYVICTLKRKNPAHVRPAS